MPIIFKNDYAVMFFTVSLPLAVIHHDPALVVNDSRKAEYFCNIQ